MTFPEKPVAALIGRPKSFWLLVGILLGLWAGFFLALT